LKMIIFHQIWFGFDFYIKLSKTIKDNKPTDSTHGEKIRYFMHLACLTIEIDLSDFLQSGI
jgi:hypothetical protein